MAMSGSEEDTYSTMFTSLRHPARRKILKMLSERPMTFSEMLEELGIPGSHLTYHLENLREFLVKLPDGKYKLSDAGESAVSIMKGAEDVPRIEAKKFSSLPSKWKSLFAVFMIGTVLLAGISVAQFAFFNQLSNDYDVLKADYEKLRNQQNLSWSSAERAMTIIRDIAQIDITRYQTTLLSSTVENRSDLGGIVEEILRYSFETEESNIDLVLRFRNNHFSLFQLFLVEGIPPFAPIYVQPQSTDVLEATRNLIERYRSISNEPYLEEVSSLLASANETNDEQILGNVKLKMTINPDSAEVLLMYTSNEFGFSAKSLRLLFQNHVLKEMSDDWFLYTVSDTQVNVSGEQAIQIARNAAKTFEWTTIEGVTVSNFTVLAEPVSAVFFPHPRTDLLTLVPYWYVTLYLDKEYPDGVNSITVGVWADTGEVANIQT
jgi:hypothetical protein